MEAEQFRRVAEERIQHDEDTLAFLKAAVFHQEMEISSLNRRLLAVHATGDDPFSPATAFDLPWLRKLAKNGVASRRNASLPAAHLEELCSELDVAPWAPTTPRLTRRGAVATEGRRGRCRTSAR
jgi:hypothetical protein